MTEKQEHQLIAVGFIGLGLVILWLMTRSQTVQPAATSPTVENNQNAGQVPVGSGSVGPLTYNVGGNGGININSPAPIIPSLAGLQMPGFSFNPQNTTDACCSSCGCDAQSPLNQFAAGVGAALSNYSSEMTNLETSYQASLFGQLPNYIAQYVSIAAPSSPQAVI